MTDSLSPNANNLPLIGTPGHSSVNWRSMICSVHVLAVTHSDPNVAVSTVECNLEYQSMGVWLNMCKMQVTALPLMRSLHRLASKNKVIIADFPFSFGE